MELNGMSCPIRHLYINSLAVICAFLCSLSAADAATDTAKAAFQRLNDCVISNNVRDCREDVTASSAALYDRFTNYGLLTCLPKDAQYVSQDKEGAYQIIRISTHSFGAKERFMRLRFVEEEGGWKLDIPESLRAGLGDNWEGQVNATEQLYLMMRKNLGDQMGCGAVQGLVKGSK